MKWVVAGGGTGGHFFPALQVAKSLRSLGDEVLFLGVRRGIEAQRVPKEGFPIGFVPFEGFRGRGLRSFRALVLLPLAVVKAVTSMRAFGAQAVFITGGYASIPAAFGSLILGIPCFLHEQNSVPGWANVLSSVFAKGIFVTFRESATFFRSGRMFHSGNVLREEFLRMDFSFPRMGSFHLLVLGGSSGARTINRAVCEVVDLFRRLGIKVTHQTGKLDFEWVDESYKRVGQGQKVLPFIEEMACALKEASFVVSRAGATTLSELSYAGRGAVLVPYPFAVGDHQKLNAEIFARGKGAWVIDNGSFTGEELLKRLLLVFFNRRRLLAMAKRARGAVKVCSAKALVERMKNEVSL